MIWDAARTPQFNSRSTSARILPGLWSFGRFFLPLPRDLEINFL